MPVKPAVFVTVPPSAKAIMMLALIHAAVDRKGDALREGCRAVELLPISKDAYDRPILATNLAAIYAQVGERDLALEQLVTLVEVPNANAMFSYNPQPPDAS